METTSLASIVLSLAFVLALIGLFGLLLKRFGPGAGLPVRRKADRRLGIVEVLPLDARRRLVLVRRDEVEHLLLLGMGDDRVVETHITPPPPPPDTPSFPTALSQAGKTGQPAP